MFPFLITGLTDRFDPETLIEKCLVSILKYILMGI